MVNCEHCGKSHLSSQCYLNPRNINDFKLYIFQCIIERKRPNAENMKVFISSQKDCKMVMPRTLLKFFDFKFEAMLIFYIEEAYRQSTPLEIEIMDIVIHWVSNGNYCDIDEVYSIYYTEHCEQEFYEERIENKIIQFIKHIYLME